MSRPRDGVAGPQAPSVAPVWIRIPNLSEVVVAHIEFDNVQWDGKCIAVWASTERGRIKCIIPRSTIHAMPLFSDAITREIDRDREEIVDRFRPALVAKIAAAESDTVELHPHDVGAPIPC